MSSTHRYIDTPIRCNISFIGTNTMARLPYADLSHPDARPLVEQIVAERGSVLHLYQMLLHSPPIARGWLNYLTAIRQLGTLPGSLREMTIDRKSTRLNSSH